MFKAILFDLDGTLIDSVPSHIRAWEDVLIQHVLELGPNKLQEIVAGIEEVLGAGGSSDLLPDLVLARAGIPGDLSFAMVREKRVLFASRYMLETQAVPGIEPALRFLAGEAGFKLAIQTTTRTQAAEGLVRNAFPGEEFFACIVGADQVPRAKPAPDVVLRAAEILGLSPSECIVVGDTRYDLEAATAARMPAVIFHPGRPAAEWMRRACGSTPDPSDLVALLLLL